MEITYLVILAICLVNMTWYSETIKIYLDDECGNGHSDGVIWEAANDKFLLENSKDTKILTTGLIDYEMIKKEEV